MTDTTPKRSVGIVTIATGKYYPEFMPTLVSSIEQFFDLEHQTVTVYCFTDQPATILGVEHFPVTHQAWPFSTLLRFHLIEGQWQALSQNDFLLYMDADMQVFRPIPKTIFEYPLIAVKHPGYLNTQGPFELDRQDSTYVAPPLRKHYFQGCFWGGERHAFEQLIFSLKAQVEADLLLGQIPIWHDESYLNAYLALHPCFALSAEFAWPAVTPPKDRNPYILHLEKPHQEIRQMQGRGTAGEKVLQGLSPTEALAMYQELYLIAHQKCQRLEARLMTHQGFWTRLREYLSYYKNKPPKSN